MAVDGINYLPSWQNATDPSDPPPPRTLSADGTLHFHNIKRIAKSGVQYLYFTNTPIKQTSDMLVGSACHMMVLGTRPGARAIVRYKGNRRSGKEWDAFEEEHAGKEILTAPEWAEAEAMAASLRRSKIAERRLFGARTEVPLRWEENGIPCSTDGVDIFPVGSGLGDLKTSSTTDPELFRKLGERMSYPQQLAWYRRGAIANGMKVGNDLFVLGVERRAPYEVVELYLTEEMLDAAERCLIGWLEKLRNYMQSCPKPRTVYDWPGYAQAPIAWDPPKWWTEEDDEGFDEEDAA
jgi:hypothetical protein